MLEPNAQAVISSLLVDAGLVSGLTCWPARRERPGFYSGPLRINGAQSRTIRGPGKGSRPTPGLRGGVPGSVGTRQ